MNFPQLFLFLTCTFCFFDTSFSQNLTDVCAIKQSKIKINGTSNVTDYSCVLQEVTSQNKIIVTNEIHGQTIQLSGAVILVQSNGFKCDNEIMTRDFYKAIKGKEFPQIKIEFQKFVLVDQVDENPNQKNVPATISITLAGKNNVYTIPLKQFKVGKDQLSIKGNLNLKMTDFNIIPPTALFGAVKTDDAIEIEFAITFVLE